MKRNVLICYIVLAASSICWCIYRDVQIEKLYTSDLRNRIVGARLQMDGISPYFYHWKSTEGTRYYDPQNYTDLKISGVTASPFMHQLLYPIADLPQRTVSRIWLLIEYLLMAAMTLMALKIARERRQKIMVLSLTLLFLYSYAWTANIEMGQYYLIVPFIAMLFYFSITRKASFIGFAAAGIFAAALILVRPTAVVFFIPFLFILKRYSIKLRAALFAGAAFLVVLAFASSFSRIYWKDYKEALGEHVKMHQYLSPTPLVSDHMPLYEKWEGWDRQQVKQDSIHFSYKRNGENGNAFVFAQLLTHHKPTVLMMAVACCSIIIALCVAFLFRTKTSNRPDISFIAILGFCLYMTTDIFSPIYRFQYNASQWIFPLLLLAATYRSTFNKYFIGGILAGILLNAIPFVFIPMQRSLGEYLIFLCLIGILFTYKPAINK